MIIKNLRAAITGQGFLKTGGRHPQNSDLSVLKGPVDILIDKDGRISKIGSSLQVDSSDTLIDGTGLVAAPGLIDSHTHALYAGTRSREFFFRWSGLTYQEIASRGGGIANTVDDTARASDDELVAACLARLDHMMRSGTTTVEIKTGYALTAPGELRLLELLGRVQETSPGPRIYKTYLPMHALPKDRNESDFVDEMMASLATVQAKGLADFVDAFPERGFFSLQQSLRFATAAQKLGLKVRVHADELSNLETSAAFVLLGALSVDHLQCISDVGVESLSKSPTTIATLLPATSFFLGLPYANARKLVDAGARVALASDFNPGTAPEADLRLTLRLAATSLKMSAAEIFCGVTANAAAALGEEKSLGVIAPGFRADLTLWNLFSRDANDLAGEMTVDAPRPALVIANQKLLDLRL